MKGHLLDVNVLLALAWSNHQFHGAARSWFRDHAGAGWWTCAITQLGFVRLSSNPAYTPHAKTPLEATLLLRRLCEHPGHRFAETLPSCTGESFETIAARLHGHRQTTDAYLVLTAGRHRLRLLTFDGRIAAHSPSPNVVSVLPGAVPTT